jgi:3-methyladenine DNA glycosylase/8-oxoguanine DNA glycosylase
VVEAIIRPAGPYMLSLSARHAGDATRTFRDGVFAATLDVDGRLERAFARQFPDGRLHVVATTEDGLERLRFCLAVDDDHSEFLRRFRGDPLLGRSTSHLAGLRPVRVATVAHALLRALCGQLIESREARRIERRIVRAATPALDRFHVPSADLATRLLRERGLGPWSLGVVSLEGLGRWDHGLVGDLGLVKLLSALSGRRVEGWETEELLAPYDEWAGLASVYLLGGWARGLVPSPAARAA